jgi:hypothetical protein
MFVSAGIYVLDSLARSMVDQILTSMKESITDSDWLTAPTKAKAFEKLEKFRVKIGYVLSNFSFIPFFFFCIYSVVTRTFGKITLCWTSILVIP